MLPKDFCLTSCMFLWIVLSFQGTSRWRTWRTVRKSSTSGWSVLPKSLSTCPPLRWRRRRPGWSTLRSVAGTCCRAGAAHQAPHLPPPGSQTTSPKDACAASQSSPSPSANITAGAVASWFATSAPRREPSSIIFTPVKRWGSANSATNWEKRTTDVGEETVLDRRALKARSHPHPVMKKKYKTVFSESCTLEPRRNA